MMHAPHPAPHPDPQPGEDRRSFLAKMAGVTAGSLLLVLASLPFVPGLITFLDPIIRKRGGRSGLVKVATLAQIPADGVPRKFPIIAEKIDAWTKSVTEVGVVYLRRENEKDPPTAFQAACPHAGCFVSYALPKFRCPCHNSYFTVEGARENPESCPSPRDLDTLVVEVRGDEVWVDYKNFVAGIAEKVAVQ